MNLKKYCSTFLLLGILSCGPASNVIKGSILMQTTSEAHIDLGSRDGIQVGDTLTVFRELPIGAHETRTIRIGLVRVSRLIDSTHAAVEAMEGSSAKGDIVESGIRAYP